MTLQKINLEHDISLKIATGKSRRSVKWANTEMLWSEFVSRLSVPLRTPETMAEYKALPKAKRDAIKDTAGFVAGYLKEGRRKPENVESRSAITLDFDNIPYGVDLWEIYLSKIGAAACMYSTHSNTPDAPRMRLVIPLARPVSADEYGAVSRKLASLIEIDYCDDTTYEANRLMYWGSCSQDADYVFEINDAEFIEPDKILSMYHDWTDMSEWPVSSRREALANRAVKKQENPLEKHGVVGAFCRVYDIPEAMEKFLPGIYENAGTADRYTYVGGSTAGGLVLYQDGLFAYSHHGTDPAGGKLVNAFDLVRLHLYKDLDEDLPEDTLITKLPSYQKMSELAVADEDTAYQLALDRVNGAFDGLENEDGSPVETDWLKELELTNKGQIAPTIENLRLIMLNDVRLNGSYYYDTFKDRPIVSGSLPWISLEERMSQIWSDSDDAGLRNFIEMEYGLDVPGKFREAIELAMLERRRHPVREYLKALAWDGTERVEDLFIKYLGAEDSEYTRAVTKASLIGAVARIMEPGCKHDHMLVLVGPQGCGKSTTLSKLGKEWFSDSLYTLNGKDAYEQLQGVWIIEMGELAAARKSEAEQIKQFMSKRVDSFRAAYARRVQDHPRQCVFFGSTNDNEFLRDPTGARRFWPVVVDSSGIEKIYRLTNEEVDQIWAEVMGYYLLGDPWHLDSRMEIEARKNQEAHTETSEKAGMILDFVKRDVPFGWLEYTLEERRCFWGEGFEAEKTAETEPRDRVCALEVWCELFNGDPKNFSVKEAREINNVLMSMKGWEKKGLVRMGRPYGQQRGFMRIGQKLTV